jgi:hypothetical protein
MTTNTYGSRVSGIHIDAIFDGLPPMSARNGSERVVAIIRRAWARNEASLETCME